MDGRQRRAAARTSGEWPTRSQRRLANSRRQCAVRPRPERSERQDKRLESLSCLIKPAFVAAPSPTPMRRGHSESTRGQLGQCFYILPHCANAHKKGWDISSLWDFERLPDHQKKTTQLFFVIAGKVQGVAMSQIACEQGCRVFITGRHQIEYLATQCHIRFECA